MKRTTTHLTPLLARRPGRIGWAVPAGLLAACLCVVILFLATPNRATYRPYFVDTQASAFDPDGLLDTASFRDLLGGAR